jgi:hypothetical protein
MFEAERITGTDFEPNRLIEFLRPPFRRYELLTPMSPADAASVLEEIVEPRTIFRWPFSRDHRYFEGWVAESRFKISRILSYGKGFLPMIEGSFRQADSGTIVAVKIRPAWPLIAFLSGVTAILLWVFVTIDPSMPGSFGSRMLVLGVMLYIYLAMSVPCAILVRSAMSRLLKLPWSGAPNSDSFP